MSARAGFAMMSGDYNREQPREICLHRSNNWNLREKKPLRTLAVGMACDDVISQLILSVMLRLICFIQRAK